MENRLIFTVLFCQLLDLSICLINLRQSVNFPIVFECILLL